MAKRVARRRAGQVEKGNVHRGQLKGLPSRDRIGWGGWNRTSEFRSQSPAPYRLATPQYWFLYWPAPVFFNNIILTFLNKLVNNKFKQIHL